MRDILESIFQTTPETERQGLGEMSSRGLGHWCQDASHRMRETRSGFWFGEYVCIDTWGGLSHPPISFPLCTNRQPSRDWPGAGLEGSGFRYQLSETLLCFWERPIALFRVISSSLILLASPLEQTLINPGASPWEGLCVCRGGKQSYPCPHSLTGHYPSGGAEGCVHHPEP